MTNNVNKNVPKFNVVYCNEPTPDMLKAERYIQFIKHLVNVVKEQEQIQMNCDE